MSVEGNALVGGTTYGFPGAWSRDRIEGAGPAREEMLARLARIDSRIIALNRERVRLLEWLCDDEGARPGGSQGRIDNARVLGPYGCRETVGDYTREVWFATHDELVEYLNYLKAEQEK